MKPRIALSRRSSAVIGTILLALTPMIAPPAASDDHVNCSRFGPTPQFILYEASAAYVKDMSGPSDYQKAAVSCTAQAIADGADPLKFDSRWGGNALEILIWAERTDEARALIAKLDIDQTSLPSSTRLALFKASTNAAEQTTLIKKEDLEPSRYPIAHRTLWYKAIATTLTQQWGNEDSTLFDVLDRQGVDFNPPDMSVSPVLFEILSSPQPLSQDPSKPSYKAVHKLLEKTNFFDQHSWRTRQATTKILAEGDLRLVEERLTKKAPLLLNDQMLAVAANNPDPQVLARILKTVPKEKAALKEAGIQQAFFNVIRNTASNDQKYNQAAELRKLSMLLDAGVDINTLSYGVTPLDSTDIWNCPPAVAQFLKERGAKYHFAHSKPRPVLWNLLNARSSGDLSDLEVEKILSLNEDLSKPDAVGWTGWHTLAEHGNKAPSDLYSKILKKHLKSPAALNLPTREGVTPLHLAARENDVSLIKNFLQYGANPLAQDDTGESFLHVFVRHAVFDALSLPFYREIAAKHPKVLTLKNSSGVTPLDLMEARSKDERFEFMVSSDPILERGLEELKQRAAVQKILSQDGIETLSRAEVRLAVDLMAQSKSKKLSPIPPLSKDADGSTKANYETLKQAQKSLETARNRPFDLTASTLTLGDMPTSYFSELIAAAQTREAITSGKFKPTAEQAVAVSRALLEDPSTTPESMARAVWLMSRAGVELDEKIIDMFKLNEDQLLKTVQEMLATEPSKYRKVSPELAAIQLYKAFKAFREKHPLVCVKDPERGNEWLMLDKTKKQNEPLLSQPKIAGDGKENLSFPSQIIIWLSQYGVAVKDGANPDRKALAQLAKLLVQKEKLCQSERSSLLADMKRWRDEDSRVQKELLCSYLSAKAQGDVGSSALSSLFAATSTVGLNANLSPAAFNETIALYGSLDEKGRQEVMPSLVSHIVGHPRGRLFLEPPVLDKDGKPLSVLVPAADAHPGAIKKLCALVNSLSSTKRNPSSHRVLSQDEKNFVKGARTFIGVLHSNLDSPLNHGQAGAIFKALSDDGGVVDPQSKSLRNLLAGSQAGDDSLAIESECEAIDASAEQTRQSQRQFQRNTAPLRRPVRPYLEDRKRRIK